MKQQSYIGIYWTRPVPRAGFVALSPDADIAAGQSLTIRYQRDLARRHVREAHGRMIHEIALLELAPDRATREGVAEVERVVAASPPEAIFLTADFSSEVNWRPHRFLWAALPPERTQSLAPDPIPIDGRIFDPVRHFRTWQSNDDAHRTGKDAHRAGVLVALAELPDATWAMKAERLNALELRTHGGRLWTGDNLRKFVG